MHGIKTLCQTVVVVTSPTKLPRYRFQSISRITEKSLMRHQCLSSEKSRKVPTAKENIVVQNALPEGWKSIWMQTRASHTTYIN